MLYTAACIKRKTVTLKYYILLVHRKNDKRENKFSNIKSLLTFIFSLRPLGKLKFDNLQQNA